MSWIKAHYTVTIPERTSRPTLINSDHIARVRQDAKGRAQIVWAIRNRDPLTLDEPYDDIITQLLR